MAVQVPVAEAVLAAVPVPALLQVLLAEASIQAPVTAPLR